MTLLADLELLLSLKREHVRRLANQNGAAGELEALAADATLVKRPKGAGLRNLLNCLQETGVVVRRSSFDIIALPHGRNISFNDADSVRRNLQEMIFIEVKTSNQIRVKDDDFSGFFFAITEGELLAAEALGLRHRVLLVNKRTGAKLLTSIPDILLRAKSTNWQLSVQLQSTRSSSEMLHSLSA